MVVEATGSKFTRNGRVYLAVLCLAGVLWFGYDGWFGSYRQKELDSNDGQPTVNLYFNQYAPIPLFAIAVCALVFGLRATSRKIVADDNGLVFSDGRTIPYAGIKKIDKRQLAKSGHFTIEYEADAMVKTVKLSDRKYDKLGMLLDEIVRRTGAVPADEKPRNNA